MAQVTLHKKHSEIHPPRLELDALIADVIARGIAASELAEIQELGDDGYGVISQLEQLYVWLARHPPGLGHKG